MKLSYLGACFAIAQSVTFSYYIVFLTNDLGFSLGHAGGAFAILQLASVTGRIVAGWIADRLGGSRQAFILTALCSLMTLSATAFMEKDWPVWLVTVLAAAVGFAVTNWNGIYLAEITNQVQRDDIGRATSGATLVLFAGFVIGPLLFAPLLYFTGSYNLGFLLTACLAFSALWGIPKHQNSSAKSID
jgi:MFS family permease